MPSWNIHTAHAERLLATDGAGRLGIRDEDAFLLGNLLPDVHVGYMVPKERLSRQLWYKDTHFAEPSHVPEPAYWRFFELYGDAADGPAADAVLGCWAHLVADHTYNVRYNRLLVERSIEPGEEARLRKQADFDLFGRSLDITRWPHPTAGAIAQAAAFPQYEVTEGDVVAACESMEAIVRDNRVELAATSTYQMLDEAFLEEAFEAATDIMRAGLLAHAAGDPAWGAQREAVSSKS